MTQIVKQITESFVKRKSIHETNGGNLASKTGRAHRTRTCNPLIKSQLLCQIELAPHSGSQRPILAPTLVSLQDA